MKTKKNGTAGKGCTLALLPVSLFTAVAILFVRAYSYRKDMGSLYWWNTPSGQGLTPMIEFFSHWKVLCIEFSLLLAAVFLLWRLWKRSFVIKKTPYYFPMAVYLAFVLLSLLFAKYKDVAWAGWNDRLEGTAVILCYMLMLFYIINSIDSETDLKWVLYPLAVSSLVLSCIGISQTAGHDFFRTVLGQKLITSRISDLGSGSFNMWEAIDKAHAEGKTALQFTLGMNEAYQTVFHSNYTSFYLTLLIPLFAMLFIESWRGPKKRPAAACVWGLLFGLAVFNEFGASSMGGLFGCFVVFVAALVLLRLRLLLWWKPVVCIVLIAASAFAAESAVTVRMGGRLELKENLQEYLTQKKTAAPKAPAGETSAPQAQTAAKAEPEMSAHTIDYFITKGNTLIFSVDGNEASLEFSSLDVCTARDSAGKIITPTQDENTGRVVLHDERFRSVFFEPKVEGNGRLFINFVVVQKDGGRVWRFNIGDQDGINIRFVNDFGKEVALDKVPHFGFEGNEEWGTLRGYIWSRSIPLLKKTLLWGHGADTFVLYFPHNDYTGRYNMSPGQINLVVDKPHNIYLGTAINTGVMSLLGLLGLFGIYLVQSARIFWKETYQTFASYVGAGIFLGVLGFLAAGLVNDSSVSVMPLFYGILGTGIAINIMLERTPSAPEGRS